MITHGLVAYPFQLRPDRWVTLMLPADLTRADLDRLIALLQTLIVPSEAPAPEYNKG